MLSILELFRNIFSWIALLTIIFPVISSILARRHKSFFCFELRVFEIYVYFLLIFQIVALVLAYGFHLHNVILFQIFLPVHTALFSFFLIKWSGIVKNAIPFVILFLSVLIIGDYLFGNFNYSPDFMIWADSIILFSLSFFLSYKGDIKNIKLSKELIFIHIGIYLYSIITIIGISPAENEIRVFGFLVQNIAIIVSNIYFARSFICLYR
ncbi:MAG: hypothetical protein H6743_04895 [Rickettsiaceae bacterium]|nr:hypothetical protein [Rickettsiaceae bacterium]